MLFGKNCVRKWRTYLMVAKILTLALLLDRSCLCDNWKSSFLARLIFNWRTFSRRITASWSRRWAKSADQVLTNHNLRNSWCQIVRRTIRIGLKLSCWWGCIWYKFVKPNSRACVTWFYSVVFMNIHFSL